eukprot:TRINITY_DN34603_c0_g1_i1.p1 TRINITY_DN34603_c0_g1~~TRINITY_DN34603_c0_g1_i1.p1  ORF type:complete len:332 (-),score=53.52 TRINITY_DN34603_c0_g1_i1:127-1071(-)
MVLAMGNLPRRGILQLHAAAAAAGSSSSNKLQRRPSPVRRASLALAIAFGSAASFAASAAAAAVVLAVALPATRRAVRALLQRLVVDVVAYLRRAKRPVPSAADPLYGRTLGLMYSRSRLSQSWEDFLDALDLPANSPIRGHIRQLFARPDFEAQLRDLFDVLSCGRPSLSKEDVGRFSRGICGDLHVLLQVDSRVPLAKATEEDHRWIAERFDVVFPPESPLDREDFPAFAKLVLLRRVVRTLVDSIGLRQLHDGVGRPLVVEVRVELGSGEPFRVRTVAPTSAPGAATGERMTLIAEEATPASSVCSPTRRG